MSCSCTPEQYKAHLYDELVRHAREVFAEAVRCRPAAVLDVGEVVREVAAGLLSAVDVLTEWRAVGGDQLRLPLPGEAP